LLPTFQEYYAFRQVRHCDLRIWVSRLGASLAMRTLQKYLGRLRRDGRIVASGKGRATIYQQAQGRPDGPSGIAHESRTNRARVRDPGRGETPAGA
jgi:hypothetical protein